jgi:hypothetical protein
VVTVDDPRGERRVVYVANKTAAAGPGDGRTTARRASVPTHLPQPRGSIATRRNQAWNDRPVETAIPAGAGAYHGTLNELMPLLPERWCRPWP